MFSYENADYDKAFRLCERPTTNAIPQAMTWYRTHRIWGGIAIATGDLDLALAES